MWSPTHVQVTVCRVRGLLSKGKNGTNDAFVTISLGKEKFQTSVKQKSPSDLEWQEECELAIPAQGNTAEIVLTALHQNFIGVDEFLGMVVLPLSSFDVYERPRIRWHSLKSKPGQESKSKNRGEIEVRVAFTVKSGSLLDLSQSKKEKHKGSFGHLTQAAHSIGGSLLSLGSKERKGIKKLASSVGSKLRLPNKSSSSSLREDKGEEKLSRHSSGRYSDKYSSGEPDPGVISEDEDEFRFDDLSHKSSASSLNLAGSQASANGSLENIGGGDLLRRNNSISRHSQRSSYTSNESAGALQASPTKSAGENNEWNQKLFGKQGKVMPVKEEEETSVTSPIEEVPSIIIKDRFLVLEEAGAGAAPVAAPTAAPPPIPSAETVEPVVVEKKKKKKKIKAEDVGWILQPESPQPTLPEPLVTGTTETRVEVPAPQPRQRKDVDAPVNEAGEEQVVLSNRMSDSFLPSFPVDKDADVHPPVPKPRTLEPNELSQLPAEGKIHQRDLDVEYAPIYPVSSPMDGNDDHSADGTFDEFSVLPRRRDEKPPDKPKRLISLSPRVGRSSPSRAPSENLNEESVCAVEGDPSDQPAALNMYNDDTISDTIELDDSVATVDLFNDQTMQISPVERATILTEGYGTPLTNNLRRDRLLSLFSTPNSEKKDELVAPIQLDWMEPPSNCSSSQGFVGSGQLSSASTTSPYSPVTDSAVPEEINDNELESELRDQFDTSVSTPTAINRSTTSKADLSWDSYDIRMIPTPPEVKSNARADTAKKEESSLTLNMEDKPKRKKISLAPCLKTLSLDYPTADSPNSVGSPVKEQADLSGSHPDLWHLSNGEMHRKKMAASFHQRVVVGEEMVPRKDYHNRDMPSSVSLSRNGNNPLLYQGRSRDALITLLEDRDNEIADLKDYIDCLLLRVIDTCPTVLQTPLKKQASRK